MNKIKLHRSELLLRGRVVTLRIMDSTPLDRFSILIATSNFSSFQNLPVKFFLKNGTVVEETYTFMEICLSEISRDLEISYKFQVET